MQAHIEDLLYTLDLCADSLPFDMLPVHIERIQTIKKILTGNQSARRPAPVLTLCKAQPHPPREQKPESKD